MQQKAILFTFCLILLSLSVPLVSAQNASFSTLGQIGAEDILIYSFNGTEQVLLGQYNTSSPYVPLPDSDFNIVVRPSAAGRFTPALFLSDAFGYVESNAIPLVILIFLIGLFFAKWK